MVYLMQAIFGELEVQLLSYQPAEDQLRQQGVGLYLAIPVQQCDEHVGVQISQSS